MDSSELTKRLRDRTIYSSFLTQRNRIDGGCGTSIRITNNGGASFESGLIPFIKDGELSTTADQRDTIISEFGCAPPFVLGDDAFMTGYFNTATMDMMDKSGNIIQTLSAITPGKNTTYLSRVNGEGIPQWTTIIGGSNININSTNLNIFNDSIYIVGIATTVTSSYKSISFYNVGSNTPAYTLNMYDAPSAVATWIAKYSIDGQYLWSTYLTHAAVVSIRAYVSSDLNGNVYIGTNPSSLLNIYQTSDLVNPCASLPLNSANEGSWDGVIIKYNSNGIYQWATKINGIGTEFFQNLECDLDNNLYCIGRTTSNPIRIFNSTNLVTEAIILSGFAHQFNYLIKYDSNGVCQWATRIGGSNDAYDCVCKVDSSNNLYVLGSYDTVPVNIYNQSNQSTPAFTLPSLGHVDTFIVKYTSTGTALWATHISSTTADVIHGSLCITLDNGIAISATSESQSINLYNAGSETIEKTITFPPFLYSSTVLIKYDTNGAYQWSSYIPSTACNDFFRGLISDSVGNILLSTVFQDTVVTTTVNDTHPAPNKSYTTTNGGTLLLNYTSTGYNQWGMIIIDAWNYTNVDFAYRQSA